MPHQRKNPSRKAGASLGSDRGFVNKNVSTYPLAYRNAYQHRMEYIGEFCLSVAEQHLDCELGSRFFNGKLPRKNWRPHAVACHDFNAWYGQIVPVIDA
jgi:hypothetical protein